MKEFYVYKVYCGEELVYVGKGSGDRYKHVTSGKSHSALLNRLYFEHILLGKDELKVQQEFVQDELEAIEKEHHLIFENKPRCNELLKYNVPEDYEYGDTMLKGDVDWRRDLII